MIKIYNSLTHKKETLTPIHAGKVKMYVCGVTVYDYCHLGHARTYAGFDVIIRYLTWRGLEVEYVRNITDIDDKIIKRANETKVEYTEIVNRFTQAMHEDFAALGLLSPQHEPRATENIPQIINLIDQLIKNEYAYVASNGDVYYNVRKLKNYGCLAHRDIDQLESGARVEINDVKRDPLDFVLWKLAKTGEPFWTSPWGNGRPGWHIECSAMSMNLLGNHFDIHGGGKDLIFPHHENELAQSVAATNQQFVNIWMHTGYLQIEKEKMSKSLGNFLTIRELLEKYKPEVVRYFLIANHYRSSLHYAASGLEQAQNALQRFYTALRDLPKAEPIKESDFEKKFIEAMDDDFNSPIALSVLFELTHEIQKLRAKDIIAAAPHGALLKRLGAVFGILQSAPDEFLQSGKDKVNVSEIENLIVQRNKARTEKNWAEADKIRKQLDGMSILLEDGASGTTWKILRK